ncbi:MAG TPA: sigma-70 family RNA polymerase sigma factor [Candidatus Eisenbacteria bacterium]|nr:sigma-70 family RNA polymerase sigma factor [Candidatus Eisenbacteria bacterium]
MDHGSDPEREPRLGTTINLLARIRAGDPRARAILWHRFLPRLKNLVQGYTLPAHLRVLHDVEDIIMRVIERVDPRLTSFNYEREGALLRYLRVVTRRYIISITRSRAPATEEVDPNTRATGWNPEQEAIRRDQRRAVRRALGILTPLQREAVVMRLEYRFSYEEIARELDQPNAHAVRMMIRRAILKIAEHLRDHRDFES